MDDWEAIPLSRLAHAGYCLRRAALLTNEQLWKENSDTAKGREAHKRVHTSRIERRGDHLQLFEYDVFSKELNIGGKCDCIEAVRDDSGCMIPAVEFPVRLYPVEYKNGKLREEEEYERQLCAQAMCLEEMYQTSIPEGAIFYISSHRRKPVAFTEALRDHVRDTVQQLEEIRRCKAVQKKRARVHLKIDSGMVGIHRNLLICDRIYIELLGENRPHVLEPMLTKQQKKFMKAMKNFPSVLRTEFALAWLSRKNAGRALSLQAQFNKVAKNYPHPQEIQAEQALIDLARNKE